MNFDGIEQYREREGFFGSNFYVEYFFLIHYRPTEPTVVEIVRDAFGVAVFSSGEGEVSFH